VETQLDAVETLFARLAEEEVARGKALATQTHRVSLSVGGGVALVVGILAWLIGRGIARPVVSVTWAMEGLAGGDLGVALPRDRRHDELGRMIGALNSFCDSLTEAAGMRAAQVAQQAAADAEMTVAMQAIANHIETEAAEAVTRIGERAAAMSQVAAEMRSIAEHSGNSALAA